MTLSLDTYALMEIAADTPAYRGIEQERFIISSAAWGEFYAVLARKTTEENARIWLERLAPFVEDIDKETWLDAVRMRMKNPKENLSLIDALGYAQSLRKGYVFVTGDKAFKGKKNVRFIV